MDILERYYNELSNYNLDSNFECYDLDVQFVRNSIEQILMAGYINKENEAFLFSLLPDIKDDELRMELEEYLSGLDAE